MGQHLSGLRADGTQLGRRLAALPGPALLVSNRGCGSGLRRVAHGKLSVTGNGGTSGRPLGVVPTLEELLADPARATQLAAEATEAMLAEVHARQGRLYTVEGALLSRLFALRAVARPAPDQDRAVGIEGAAVIIGMKLNTLRRREKWRQLGGYRDMDGRVKFTLAGLQRHLARKSGGRPGATTAMWAGG